MRWPPWHSLRVQLAMAGFVAIYVPVLMLFSIIVVTEEETTTGTDIQVTHTTLPGRSPWISWTVAGLFPVAGMVAWKWAGRATRPIERVRAVAEDIEVTDLGRRIGIEKGPTEVVALAASFDAMLDRLEHAGDTQRRLVEEASHELRTPLSVLATNADVLLAHPEPTVEVYRQGLERSKAAAVQLQSVIDELLVDARGRARTIDRQPADLMAIVRGVVDDARVLAAPKHVALSLDGPATAVCSIDEQTVRRAVANLVDNAIRYGPEGSAVAVAVAVTESDAAVVVTDHGPGIPGDAQDQIFERFWRGRPDTHGTGLGLPIANQVALAHGGSLSVTSPGPAGDGSAFELRLRR